MFRELFYTWATYLSQPSSNSQQHKPKEYNYVTCGDITAADMRTRVLLMACFTLLSVFRLYSVEW
jgi:hypothetical protein